ncbi:unnamed protein product [Closterium sp. NIES-65]|nr:unnamed protein product [Closterium sp. NIES-65]
MAGTHELREAMEMRMRALDVQLEETRRELAAAKGDLSEHKSVGQAEEETATKGQLAAAKGEFAAGKAKLASVKGRVAKLDNRMLKVETALEEVLVSLVRDDWGSTRALTAVSTAFSGETKQTPTFSLTALFSPCPLFLFRALFFTFFMVSLDNHIVLLGYVLNGDDFEATGQPDPG